MNAAARRRHMAIVSMVAGAREMGIDASIALHVDEAELADVRDLISSTLGAEQSRIGAVSAEHADRYTDTYYWYDAAGKKHAVYVTLTARRAPRADVIPLDTKLTRQQRHIAESVAKAEANREAAAATCSDESLESNLRASLRADNNDSSKGA